MPLAPDRCLPGSTGAAFPLPEGTLSVLLVGPNVAVAVAGGGTQATATATTADGYVVVVSSEAAVPGREPPYADELSRLAGAVAARS